MTDYPEFNHSALTPHINLLKFDWSISDGTGNSHGNHDTVKGIMDLIGYS